MVEIYQGDVIEFIYSHGTHTNLRRKAIVLNDPNPYGLVSCWDFTIGEIRKFYTHYMAEIRFLNDSSEVKQVNIDSLPTTDKNYVAKLTQEYVDNGYVVCTQANIITAVKNEEKKNNGLLIAQSPSIHPNPYPFIVISNQDKSIVLQCNLTTQKVSIRHDGKQPEIIHHATTTDLINGLKYIGAL